MGNEELRDLLNHHWEQVRHVDKLRYRFTNVFAVLVVGLLTIATQTDSIQLPFLLLSILFLSLIGIITYLKLGIEYYLWVSHAIVIQKELSIDDVSARPSGLYEDDYDKSLMNGILTLLTSPKGVFNPDRITTTELLSTSHWQLGLQILAFSLSLGWLITVPFSSYLTPYSWILIAVLTALILSLISYTVYRYAHGKLARVDEHLADIDYSDSRETEGSSS